MTPYFTGNLCIYQCHKTQDSRTDFCIYKIHVSISQPQSSARVPA